MILQRRIFPYKAAKIHPIIFQFTTPREVTAIRKMAPVNVIVYHPKTEGTKEELARRVSDVHAASVNQHLKSLNCPTSQKLELLEAVIATARKRSREQTF